VEDTLATDADGEPDDPYLAPLVDHKERFDVVVVDGLARNACCRLAPEHLTDTGLILLDDSDRTAYRNGHDALAALGFGRVDFFGPKPGVGHLSVTSVFCKDFNAWTRGLRLPDVSGY